MQFEIFEESCLRLLEYAGTKSSEKAKASLYLLPVENECQTPNRKGVGSHQTHCEIGQL